MSLVKEELDEKYLIRVQAPPEPLLFCLFFFRLLLFIGNRSVLALSLSLSASQPKPACERAPNLQKIRN